MSFKINNNIIFYQILDTDYYVSDCGKILSGKYNKDLIIKLRKNKYGYLSFTYRYNNKQCTMSAHRAVATVFLNNNTKIPSEITVDHIDFNTSNNNLRNLRLLSKSDNSKRKDPSKKCIRSEAARNILVKLKENHEFITKQKTSAKKLCHERFLDIDYKNKVLSKLKEFTNDLNHQKMASYKSAEKTSKKVIHVSSGTIYNSIMDASRYHSDSREKIKKHIHNKVKNPEWKFYE